MRNMNPNKKLSSESGDPMGLNEGYVPGSVRGDRARTELYARVVILQEQQSTLNADLERAQAAGDTKSAEARRTQLAVISADLATAKQELGAVDAHVAKMRKSTSSNDN